jgi:nucleoside phosphorylase
MSTSTSRTLVLSAWEPEVEPLRRLLSAHARQQSKGKGRSRAGLDVELDAVGVGTVDAGIGAAGAIARVKPRRVIFVGTAGVYPAATRTRARSLAIGSAALAGELRLVSAAALRGDAYHPAPLVAAATTTPTLLHLLARAAGAETPAPIVQVACPLAITRAPALARRFAATGAALENLEAFAVARAAAAAGVEFAAVLGISNQVGPRAHNEWRAHHLAASRAACHLVWAFLRAGRA